MAASPRVEPEREPGTRPDGGARVAQQPGRHIPVGDDGEPPVVQGDQLGQRRGAQPPAVAGDEVHPQPYRPGHRPPPGGTGATPPDGTGSTSARAAGAPAPGVPLQLGAERPQRTAHQPHRAVRVGAAAAPVDLAEPPSQQGGIGAVTVREPLDQARDRGQAEPARTALPGGLGGQVAHHPGRLAASPQAPAGSTATRPAPGPAPRSASPAAENGRADAPAAAAQAPTNTQLSQ